MSNWKAYFDNENLRGSLKKERTKRNIKYALIALTSLILIALLGAMIGSPTIAKLIFGSLFLNIVFASLYLYPLENDLE